MPQARDLKHEPYTSFLFKSSFGFGKTLAALSFALEGPIHLAYWDKKSPVEILTWFTEKRFGPLANRIIDNIEYDVYSSENPNAYLNKLIAMNEKQDCRYVAMVCDSVTFMTASAVHWSQNFGKKGRAKNKVQDVIPDFDEYKVETNLVSQCLDLSRNLPCHTIWTAHPLPGIKVEGTGSSMRVTKTNPIVSYGSKVAGMIPGSFTEIYHFGQTVEWTVGGGSKKKFTVFTEAVGDEFAKSPLLGDYVKEFDITDKLFYQVWKDLLDKSRGIESQGGVGHEVNQNFDNPFLRPT